MSASGGLVSLSEVGQLTLLEAEAQLDVLTAIAKDRLKASDPMFAACMGGAEIDFMTTEERTLRHALILKLPTAAELRTQAAARIQARIAARRSSKLTVQSAQA